MTKYAAALLFACSLHAQTDSIHINGTELRVGMSKSDVLALLAERNDLAKVKGMDDAWCVRAKEDHVQPACGNLIQFGRDKLSTVSRAMGSVNGEDAAVMMASLFSTLDGLEKSGKTNLTFSTQELETDDHIRLRILSFVAGGKEYVFTINQPVGSQSAKSSSVELQERFARQSNGPK
jgi:hypothetical protein